MKKIFLSVSLFFLVVIASYAQDPTKQIRTNLIPASPTAGSIAKAGEVPVNLSTGLPGINIPVFNLQGNDLSLPVSLNYNYDGFKPAQSSGWVGLGWSLDAGGVITRTIHGKLDETTSNGDFDHPYVKSQVNNFNVSQEFLRAASLGSYDTEPDVFNFSFPGYSGKFIKYAGKYYVMPSQKIKVTGGGASFTIVTEDGTKYFFNETEWTEPKGQSGVPYNIPSYISSWYLTRIENAATTEAITLSYTTEGKLTNAGAFTQSYKKPYSLIDGPVGDPSSSFPTFVYPKRLTSIITDKYAMSFIATDDRQDVNQSAGGAVKALKKIIVNSTVGTFSKTFNFNQSYFGSGFNLYLKLNSFQECPTYFEGESGTTNDTLTHKFEYEEMPNPPSRNRAYVDHFGFYHGDGDFSNMLMPQGTHANGVNRDPAFGGTVQGALKRITYPAGGNTTFEYESNMKFDGMNYLQNTFYSDASVTRPSNNQIATYNGYGSRQIIITQAQNVNVYLTRTARSPYADNFTRNLEKDFVITDASNSIVFYGINGLESEGVGKTYSTYLQPGTYNLMVTIDSRELSMDAHVTFTAPSNTPIEGKISGGLRIKRTVTTPLIGIAMKREYSYTDLAGFSSGFGPSDTYDTRIWKDIYCRPSGIDEVDFAIVSSTISESYGSGVQHYYTSVLEKQIAGQDTLFTRSDFKSYNDYFMGISPIKVTQYRKNISGGLVPATIKSYEYGIVTDTLFTAIKPYQNMVVIFEGCQGYSGPTEGYTFTRYDYYQGWKYLKETRDTVYENGQPMPLVTENIYNADRNLEMVRSLGSDGKIQITKYKYPESYVPAISGSFLNAHVLSPIFEQQVWVKNGADSVLVSAGVVEHSTVYFKPQNQYLMGIKGLTSLNSESLYQGKFNALLSDTRYEPRISLTYNNLGRLVRQQMVHGISTGYKWGFSNTLQNYPIAEIKNSSENEFFIENFEEDPSASVMNAHTGDRCFVGDFTLNWSIPNGRSYIVSFFYRTGNVWSYKQQNYTGPTVLSDGDAIDDVAIYPSDAQLNSYVYYPGIGLRAIIDTKGQTTSFSYDKLGRQLAVLDQNKDVVKAYKYNYAKGGFYSTGVSGTFTKNNCSGGTGGSSVVYSIPPGTFVSQVSQQDADSQATAALASGGQAYANANGGCNIMVQFSFVNSTNPDYPGGPNSASIFAVYFKNTNGTTLYTFYSNAINNGFSVPQGTYNIELSIIGQAYDFQSGKGWGSWDITSANGAVGSAPYMSSPYVVNNVNLTGITSATLNLKGGGSIE